MRAAAPFQPSDLEELDVLLSRAPVVVAMEDALTAPANALCLRHDVDNDIRPAVQVAEWEADRGYRSTFFVLHSAPYWADNKVLRSCLEQIAMLGHEIAVHNDALTVALQQGRPPGDVLHDAVYELRAYGFEPHGVVAHGHALCSTLGYVNDELFVESRRPKCGEPDRVLAYKGREVRIPALSWADFGFDYDPNWNLPRGLCVSDSGGRWSQPFDGMVPAYKALDGKAQLHMLWHPDWWGQAFERVPA